MDPIQAANRLFDAVGTSKAKALVLGPGATFLRNVPDELRVLDVVMKRNLVFASYEGEDASGTWVLSFDREGLLISWSSL